MPLSLNTRVLIAASAVLFSFFGLAEITLERIYHDSIEQDMEERMFGHVYALISAAEMGEDGRLIMDKELPDTRFYDPESGLYGQVSSNDGEWLWQSESMRGMSIPFTEGLPRLALDGRQVTLPDGHRLYLFSYGVVWSDSPEPGQDYTFSVAQDMTEFDARIAAFRGSLWGTLGGVALLLLAVQWGILRWGLLPLKHAADELRAIEEGVQTRLKGRYPLELQTLTSNINGLLSHQREHLERYRRTLGDLAHSLKTPLAILQSAAENRDGKEELPSVVLEQVERMNQLTGYQLQRAATSGWTVLSAPIAVQAVVEKVLAGLHKVYADKGVKTHTDLQPGLEFAGDEGDLMEIIGNLTDNAFKWCRGQVHVQACSKAGPRNGEMDLFIHVEDDGPGIPSEMVRYVMQRGRRADSDIAGHGIGLSIVRDIVQLYGGTLEIGESELGGAAVHVWLPAGPKG
ncbi:MAG TPA: GHKL domain-containing protein [Gammaproteobacteria bacterium]|nr:GHKL domain-containing protein [Gammaproteobacteria bacterium]